MLNNNFHKTLSRVELVIISDESIKRWLFYWKPLETFNLVAILKTFNLAEKPLITFILNNKPLDFPRSVRTKEIDHTYVDKLCL